MNHLEAAKKRGAAALAHVGVALQKLYPHSRVTHADGQSLNYPASSQLVLHQNEEDRYFSSTTGTANALKQGGFVDIRLPAGSLQLVKGMCLELKITNDTGVNIGVARFNTAIDGVYAGGPPGAYGAPAQVLLDRVELLAESGSTLISRTESSHMLGEFRLMDPGQAYLLRAASDIGPQPFGTVSSQPPSSFVNGETRTVYIPLNNALTRNHVFCGGLRSDLYVRVWFRGGPAAWASAANGPPTLTSMSLIVRQDNLGRAENAALMSRYRSETLDFRFMRPSFQSITENLQPSQRYQWQLTAVHGLISDLCIMVRMSNATGTQLLMPEQLASVELLDSSGQNIVGGSALTSEYVRRVKTAYQVGNSEADLQPGNAVYFDFGSTRANHEHGALTGYIVGDGALQLAITTPATLTAGSYEVRVEFHAAARMRIAGGSIEVFPS